MISFTIRLTVYHSFSYVSPAARLRNGMERGKEWHDVKEARRRWEERRTRDERGTEWDEKRRSSLSQVAYFRSPCPPVTSRLVSLCSTRLGSLRSRWTEWEEAEATTVRKIRRKEVMSEGRSLTLLLHHATLTSPIMNEWREQWNGAMNEVRDGWCGEERDPPHEARP